MALSNMRREPQREITESVIGLVIFGGAIGVDYYAARCIFDMDTTIDVVMGMIMVPVFAIAAFSIIMLLLFFTHIIGDEVCNVLQKRGIHLRPRNRPNQR